MRKTPVTGKRRAADKGYRRRLSPEVRREQIMRAALKLFSRQGFERTTTREIAREAGISEGTIYTYYESKEEVLFAFIKSAAVETLGSLIDSLEGADDDRVIGEFFATRFELISRAPELQKVLLGEALFNPQLAEAFGRKLVLPVLDILERYIARRVRERKFRPVDPTLAARALVGHFLAFTVFNALLGPRKQVPAGDLVAGLTSFFLDGIRRPPQGRNVSPGGV